MHSQQPALILLGPTGSGKTPLGNLLEQRSLNSRTCVHFDFGEQLRELVARATPDEVVSAEDIVFLQRVLAAGALLEDEQFPIAKRVLASFLPARRVATDTIVVMNGLPRHVGQAEAMADMLDVLAVVALECSADVVLRRIASNTGGDRTSRIDDDVAAVEKKLEIFARRTAPLVEYYRQRQVQIVSLCVSATMSPAEMYRYIASVVPLSER